MIRKISIALAVALSVAACASANKRYEQGLELQRSGRPAEAAERYIQALKKDSRLDSARAGLRSAGAAAIDGYLRTAADPTTSPAAAAENFIAIDDLSRRSIEVGIFLPPPADYDARRRAAFDRAINAAVADARALSAQRQYADALNRLTRASTAFQPTQAQANAMGGAGADVALAWARADTAEGRFRSAHARVERIGELPGVSRTQTEDARTLQAAALARGTRRVAVIPPWATVAVSRSLPDEAILALGDALVENPWASPPPFVTMLAPYMVDRDLRRMGLSRRPLSVADAGRFARVAGADYVVTAEVDSVRREDSNVRVTRRPARTRSGIDTAYVIEEGTARLFAQTTFVLTDPNGQRVSEYRPVTATVTTPFTRVRFAGDYRTLDLRQAERDLFTRGSNERELVGNFVAAISPRLGEAVFAELTRVIP